MGGKNNHESKNKIVLWNTHSDWFTAAFQDFVYLVFAMKVLCFALFACAFNLLLGFTGLLSFGHAAFFGTAAYNYYVLL